MLSWLDAFADLRLLVVGDVILDEYLWGEVERVSPEAPVPVVHIERESVVLGGAGNVVRNIVALGASCDFVCGVGDDEDGRLVRELVKDEGVEGEGVLVIPGRQTTRKTRVVARSQQVLRFDREVCDAVPAKAEAATLGAARERLGRVQGLILEDYGKGLLTRDVASGLVREAHAAGCAVAVDPKQDLGVFRGADLIKPSLREAEAMSGARGADLDLLAARLRSQCGNADLVITQGARGMTLFPAGGGRSRVPSVARDVFDVQGAGDTTIATLALARAAGAPLRDAAILANAAAGIVVAKMGTATATRDEVVAALPEILRAAASEDFS